MTEPLPTLPRHLLLACYEEAARVYPNEACGLLGGVRNSPELSWLRLCENAWNRQNARSVSTPLSVGHRGFRLCFSDVIWLLEQALTDSPPQVLFHSHADCGTALSFEDQHSAQLLAQHGLFLDHLILDITNRNPKSAQRYRQSPDKLSSLCRYDATGHILPNP